MPEFVYRASVYSRVIPYFNPKTGEQQTQELFFAIDPINLMRVISKIQLRSTRSGNPAKAAEQTMDNDKQLQLIVDLADEAAGDWSEDGEVWIPFENFKNHIVGKAFMNKLSASDADRKEFAQKVIVDPFAAFVGAASAEPGNSPKEIQEFQLMLTQLENIFLESNAKKDEETLDARRTRLASELAALEEKAPEGE